MSCDIGEVAESLENDQWRMSRERMSSVHRCGASGSMRACQAVGPGSIPGRDKLPG